MARREDNWSEVLEWDRSGYPSRAFSVTLCFTYYLDQGPVLQNRR